MNGYERKCNSESSLRERGMATWPACGFEFGFYMWGLHSFHSSHTALGSDLRIWPSKCRS